MALPSGQEKLMPSAPAAPFSPLPWLKPNPALDDARPPRTVPYGYFLRFMPVLLGQEWVKMGDVCSYNLEGLISIGIP